MMPNNPPKVLLWLDDVRDPQDIRWKEYTQSFDCDQVVWVKDYNEFVEWITQNDLPAFMSLDHDLSPDHYVPKEYWGNKQAEDKWIAEQASKEKTGMDCVKWLVDYCNLNRKRLPLTVVHSFNTSGRENMRAYLSNASKHLGI